MATLTRLRPAVADHTLVRLLPRPAQHPGPLSGTNEMSAALYQLLADADQPMPVMELAARLSLPRAVVATLVTALAKDRLIQLSAACPPGVFARWVHDPDTPGPHPAGMVSVKIAVVGPRGAGATTYVGAASDRAPVRTVETVLRSELTSLSLELGAIEVSPASRLHLLAAPAPTVFDALWPGVVREAAGALVMVHPDRPGEALPTLLAVQDTELPYLVVVNRMDGIEPDLDQVASVLGVETDQVLATDARSRTATRAAIARILHRLEAAS